MPNLRKIVIFGDQTPPADDRRVLERSVFSGAWVRGTEGEVQQLVERDHLLSYLRDVEIEAGSYGEGKNAYLSSRVSGSSANQECPTAPGSLIYTS